ncbi:MAG: TolC family protein [Candidatus Omnitrophica bacterium]|nr:TolC family protein [Candidatus Omnitrophota bacterium]
MRCYRHIKHTTLLLCFFYVMLVCGAGGAETEKTGPVDMSFSGTMPLNDCVVFAVANSFEVKLAKLDLYIAETGLMYSEAAFDTFLSGGYSYSEDRRKRISSALSRYDYIGSYHAAMEKTLPTGTDVSIKFEDRRARLETDYAGIGFYHVPELTFNVEQPVGKNAFGFINRSGITLTALAIENAGLSEQDRIEALIAKVEKAYWNAVFQKRALEIYENILGKAKKLHDVNEKNYDIGIMEKVDFVASRANLSKREAEVIVAGNRYRRAEENLKLVMNMDEDLRVTPRGKLKLEHLKEDLADCLKISFGNRRDYKIAKRDIEITGLNVKVKSNSRWPEIDFVATAALNGLDADIQKAAREIPGADNPYYYVGVEFEIPIENKEAESEYLAAKLEKQKALIEIKDVERTIITEVGNSFRDVLTFESGLKYIRDAVVFQSEKLAEEEKRFNYGRSTTKNIIDYQQDLLRTELEEAQYLLDNSVARVDLERDMNVILAKYKDEL